MFQFFFQSFCFIGTSTYPTPSDSGTFPASNQSFEELHPLLESHKSTNSTNPPPHKPDTPGEVTACASEPKTHPAQGPSRPKVPVEFGQQTSTPSPSQSRPQRYEFSRTPGRRTDVPAYPKTPSYVIGPMR